MQDVISPFISFPNIYWWHVVITTGRVCFDKAEYFQKMSYRNRYYITGANGLIPLSIPLQQGREQRKRMAEVGISFAENWQVQHWRTLVSVYNRSPYFQHYEPSLQQLFEKKFELLYEFNLASVVWLINQLKADVEIKTTDVYRKEYENDVADLRNLKPGAEKLPVKESEPYYQLFNERNGFIPNLSILDLLFSEGPYALQWLKNNAAIIDAWNSI